MQIRRHLLLLILAYAALCIGAPAAAAREVRRCTNADGSIVVTDKPCAAIDASERLPRFANGGVSNRPYRGCVRTLDALSYEVASAIDLQDANRLAGVYDWTGMDSRNAWRVFARLETIVKRPLVDIGPAGGGIDAEPQWREDAEGNLVPVYPKARAPTGLRVEQLLGRNGSSSTRTTFGLRRRLDCLLIQL